MTLTDDQVRELAALWVSTNPRAGQLSREQLRFQADALLERFPALTEDDVDAWLDAVESLLSAPVVP